MRILEIISPGGFEHYIADLADDPSVIEDQEEGTGRASTPRPPRSLCDSTVSCFRPLPRHGVSDRNGNPLVSGAQAQSHTGIEGSDGRAGWTGWETEHDNAHVGFDRRQGIAWGGNGAAGFSPTPFEANPFC